MCTLCAVYAVCAVCNAGSTNISGTPKLSVWHFKFCRPCIVRPERLFEYKKSVPRSEEGACTHPLTDTHTHILTYSPTTIAFSPSLLRDILLLFQPLCQTLQPTPLHFTTATNPKSCVSSNKTWTISPPPRLCAVVPSAPSSTAPSLCLLEVSSRQLGQSLLPFDLLKRHG